MQTISVPYRCSEDAAGFIAELRRIYSAAVRTAYANSAGSGGESVSEKTLRHLVKSRFAGGAADAWLLHCATLEGREKRKLVPDGSMIFGGRKDFERRRNGLIGREEWRSRRLLPLASRGDKERFGNRHFRLSADARSCSFAVYGHRVELQLSRMTGNAGEILRQAAQQATEKQINVMFRIDATHLHVTIDPMDLPDHPERRRPVEAMPDRAVGIDLNPNWIGMAAVENSTEPDRLEETALREHQLVQLDLPAEAPAEQIREALAAAARRAISLARKHRAGVIVLESGLGKLRSGGRNRPLNRTINYWARTVFLHMLTRKARLAGIKVIEVWGGYSTTIGNLAFEAPDACASAAEIGRRGVAREAGMKDVLPVMMDEVVSGIWKDQPLPNSRPSSWGDLHRDMKVAKLGVRRPHPEVHGDCRGHVVSRLGCRNRPGWVFHPPGQSADGRRTVGSLVGIPH